jgi:AcrR family transcriptional regulator
MRAVKPRIHLESAPSARTLPAGRRERNKNDKLRRIKQAAWNLFTSKGFDDTTTREIAAAADVGLGTVFVYAANKRDLLFLIANEGLEEIARKAEASVRPGGAMLDNLVNAFRHHYEFFARQPAISRLVLREMTFYDAGAQAGPFQATRESLIDLLGTIVRHAQDHRTIGCGETPEFIGWAIFCIYQAELRRWIALDKPDVRSGLLRLRRTLALVGSGLMPHPRRQRVQAGSPAKKKSQA